MSTAIVPFGDMQQMATAIAKSNLFGMKTPDQVLALMLIAQAEGRHPAIVARDYDIIQGRPAKKSEAMLRDFIDSGGEVKWHKYDDDGADATFSHPKGGSLRVTWDAARAKKAGLSGKDNYNKYGRQMYGSRVISEGVRKVYPAATSGLYEPGEVRQIARDDKAQPKDMGPVEEVKDEEDEAFKELEQAPAPTMPTEAPKPRSDTISELCLAAGMDKLKVLAKGGVSHPDEMGDDDWTDCVAMLRRRITQKMVSEAAASQP